MSDEKPILRQERKFLSFHLVFRDKNENVDQRKNQNRDVKGNKLAKLREAHLSRACDLVSMKSTQI